MRYKVPFRPIWAAKFRDWLGETIYCHIVLKLLTYGEKWPVVLGKNVSYIHYDDQSGFGYPYPYPTSKEQIPVTKVETE